MQKQNITTCLKKFSGQLSMKLDRNDGTINPPPPGVFLPPSQGLKAGSPLAALNNGGIVAAWDQGDQARRATPRVAGNGMAQRQLSGMALGHGTQWARRNSAQTPVPQPMRTGGIGRTKIHEALFTSSSGSIMDVPSSVALYMGSTQCREAGRNSRGLWRARKSEFWPNLQG